MYYYYIPVPAAETYMYGLSCRLRNFIAVKYLMLYLQIILVLDHVGGIYLLIEQIEIPRISVYDPRMRPAKLDLK